MAATQGLEIVGMVPPTTVDRVEPKKKVPVVRPPSAAVWPAGPGLLSQQMREQRLPLTIKATEKKGADLHLTKYTSSADVSIAASKLYASAIQKAQESVKQQDKHSTTFI